MYKFILISITAFLSLTCSDETTNNILNNGAAERDIFMIRRNFQTDKYSTFAVNVDGSSEVLINDTLLITSQSYAGKITLAKLDSVYYFNNLYTANTDGSNIVAIPRNDYYPVYFVLSPKGDKVLFTTDAGNYLCVVNSNGSNFIQISDGIRGTERIPKFSPDGSRVAFFEAPPNLQTALYTINTDGNNKTMLKDSIIYQQAAMLDWSPDGSRIVFENGNAPATKICIVDTNGNNYIELTEGINPSWSRDGAKIAYLKNVNQGIFDLFVMNSNGTSQENISNTSTGYERDPYFSPAKYRKILFSLTTGMFGELKVFDVDDHSTSVIADSVTWGFWRY